MTRLSVPTSSVSAMPTETWNSDSRSRRDQGNSPVCSSAKGSRWRRIVPPVTLTAPLTVVLYRLTEPPDWYDGCP